MTGDLCVFCGWDLDLSGDCSQCIQALMDLGFTLEEAEAWVRDDQSW